MESLGNITGILLQHFHSCAEQTEDVQSSVSEILFLGWMKLQIYLPIPIINYLQTLQEHFLCHNWTLFSLPSTAKGLVLHQWWAGVSFLSIPLFFLLCILAAQGSSLLTFSTWISQNNTWLLTWSNTGKWVRWLSICTAFLHKVLFLSRHNVPEMYYR